MKTIFVIFQIVLTIPKCVNVFKRKKKKILCGALLYLNLFENCIKQLEMQFPAIVIKYPNSFVWPGGKIMNADHILYSIGYMFLSRSEIYVNFIIFIAV